ncbi:MAG TPA: hypothetical protein PKN48_09560 [Bacteroidales bacterium]|nr:hypothetical protein [Bacteroidales bacterium]
MNYTKTAFKELPKLVSKINFFLSEEKNINIPDLIKLEDFFKHPENKIMHGSLTLLFSSHKKLKNGTMLKLNETINFRSNDFLIKSSWQENYNGEYIAYECNRFGENEPDQYIGSSISFSLNAVRNILIENKGNFVIRTNQFQINRFSK